jgi:hypothetical protein
MESRLNAHNAASPMTKNIDIHVERVSTGFSLGWVLSGGDAVALQEDEAQL